MASSIFQGAILWIFKPSFWSWRFSSGVAALLAVFPTYLLARELFNRRVALIAIVSMISMPFYIAFARMGYNNSQALFPAALSMYLFYAGLRRKSLLYLGWAGMAAGLGAYTYPSAQVSLLAIFPILGALGIRSITRGRQRMLRILGLATVFLLTWLVTAMPVRIYMSHEAPEFVNDKFYENVFFNSLYAHDIFPPNELYRDYPPIVVGQQTLFYRPDLYIRLLVRGTVHTLLALHSGLNVTQHYITGALPGPIGVVWYTIGLAVALRYLRQPQMILLLLWLAGGAVSLSIANVFPPRQTHLVAIIPVLAILLAVGLVAMVDVLMGKLRNSHIATGVVTVLVIITAAIGLWNYFVVVPSNYPPYEEDIIGFDAMNLEQPGDLIFVAQTAERMSFMPWLVANIPHQANYSTVLLDDLQQNKLVLATDRSTTIYCSTEDAAIVEQWIQHATGLPVVPHLYQDRDKRVFFVSFESPLFKTMPTKP
jgi:4-amino-4-deoxy-L-arabinose transferase-like glycosyltransferase